MLHVSYHVTNGVNSLANDNFLLKKRSWTPLPRVRGEKGGLIAQLHGAFCFVANIINLSIYLLVFHSLWEASNNDGEVLFSFFSEMGNMIS